MTKAAKKPAGPYHLGPQEDGSIVVRIPDDSHLVTARKAFEKQKKNAAAARGTMSALKDASDPLIDEVERELDGLIRSFAGAREPDKQLSNTPIGDALQQAVAAGQAGVKGEPIDGQPEGTVWAPHVPMPRPRLGQMIVHPSGGQGVGITDIEGYDASIGVFVVKAGAAGYNVFAHFEQNPGGESRVVWRLNGEAKDYTTPHVVPNHEGTAPLLPGDELVQDAAEGASAAERDLAEDEVPPETDASGESRTVAPTKGKRGAGAARPANPAQRSRNVRSAGIRKPERGSGGGSSTSGKKPRGGK